MYKKSIYQAEREFVHGLNGFFMFLLFSVDSVLSVYEMIFASADR